MGTAFDFQNLLDLDRLPNPSLIPNSGLVSFWALLSRESYYTWTDFFFFFLFPYLEGDSTPGIKKLT